MAGTKEIKRRIKSVKNTKKITKAMELVAASKMKRAVNSALASRLYAEYSWNILNSIGQNIANLDHPYFNEREVKNILFLVITSNRGQCGAYNAQILKKTLGVLKEKAGYPEATASIAMIGKKGDAFMKRVGVNIIASFTEIPDSVNLSDINPVSSLITEDFKNMKYDKVFVAYTTFISPLLQKPTIRQVLPVSKADLLELMAQLGDLKNFKTPTLEVKNDYIFEGNMKKLVSDLAEKITTMQIYQMILESNASEQSSRMIAMKNATEAAEEMIDDLTLVFNKARQAGITQEISEISAGMSSLE
ncbi:MAG: ATP synthase F1 subunit gamma [Candidatus Pacebacteria bacterium]|nr:ATP synthase F1 subunit gamma [Candidatus Paceibacterota bacterium]MCF7863121.1 ATP synthase F1 subunit gamma [Candidatus Paceibacterota bacterium]